ncbi:fumarylacetoacetate hydrolase family protein [Pradoshia sp.]|uniref:fumarylacetoacetate hydrolase family protein n=1 Tax=Pradoshia sp. TaxID=2651281 RepID=UPI003F0F4E6D
MKLATVVIEGKEKAGVIEGELFYPLESVREKMEGIPTDLNTLIEHSSEWLSDLAKLNLTDMEGLAVESLQYASPIKPNKNIFCIGKNYAAHAREFDGTPPENMIVFTKAPTTVIGHGQPIPLHEGVTNELDYEGELAVVIGKKGKAISRDEAEDYIFGYTILNDITARDLQARHQQFFLGKSLDGTCPIGPWIVTKDEAGDARDLEIETKVNGEVRQHARTSLFLFPIDEIIATLSKGMTLEPGDIIATGTPAGVGKGFKPPRYLKDGDVIEICVESIGTLVNKVQS